MTFITSIELIKIMWSAHKPADHKDHKTVYL